MLKFDRYTSIRSAKEVAAALEQKNAAADAWAQALAWLKEATADKLDKKATQAIFEKHTNSTGWTWRAQTAHIGNGYGWSITLGDYRYATEGREKEINITICREDSYDKKYLRELAGYDYRYGFAKGATWREVIENIEKYANPKKASYSAAQLEKIRALFADVVERVQKLEEQGRENEKENNFYYELFIEN